MDWTIRISSRLFKDSVDITARPLTKVCNMISGVVPTNWMKARVTPLYKNGNVADMGNYRLISVLH